MLLRSSGRVRTRTSAELGISEPDEAVALAEAFVDMVHSCGLFNLPRAPVVAICAERENIPEKDNEETCGFAGAGGGVRSRMPISCGGGGRCGHSMSPYSSRLQHYPQSS